MPNAATTTATATLDPAAPIALERCCHCGRPAPGYYLTRGLCDDCKWDTWIPEGYAGRERYVFSEIWGHENATRRPRLEVDFLDVRAELRREL